MTSHTPSSIDTPRHSIVLYTAIIALACIALPVQGASQFSTHLFSSPSKDSSCPSDALSRAQACTAKLAPLQVAGSLHSDKLPLKDTLQEACVEGYLLDAVSCLERILLSCQHATTDEAHLLRSNIDVEKTRRTIIYFCTNLKTYTSNLECVQKNLLEVSECSHEAKVQYMTQMQATKNKDSLLRFQCPFFNKIVTCAQSVLKEKCNNEISDFVFTVLAGHQPPICADSRYSLESGLQLDGNVLKGGENGSASIRSQCLLISFLFVTILLIRKCSVRW